MPELLPWMFLATVLGIPRYWIVQYMPVFLKRLLSITTQGYG